MSLITDSMKSTNSIIQANANDLKNDNIIYGEKLDDFIFNKIRRKIDPVIYCEEVLRASLDPKKRKLHENQVALIRAVCNPSIKKVAALMSRQAGKCFAKDTEVLMANGLTKKVQDIQVGDYIMSPDSKPALVTALGNGQEEMFEVIPKEQYHESFTVNKSHILSLIDENGKVVNISVENYLKLNNKKLKGYRVSIDYPYKETTINPYEFGANLNNIDIIQDFIINNREVRLQLLAGIIDSDNYKKIDCIYSNSIYILFANELLAHNILNLVRSLGFGAITYKKDTNYVVKIYGDLSIIPTKKNKYEKQELNKNPLVFDFDLVSKGIGKYYGFTIDTEDHLFLLGDYTVTHNTESIASFCGFLLDNYPQMRIGIFTPRIQQAEIDVGRISVFYQMNEEKLNNKLVKVTKDVIELSNGSRVMAVSGSDQSNIEGLTFDIIILDEAQKISNYTWSERIVPMGGATNAKMIKIGTPKYRNHFYECFYGNKKADEDETAKKKDDGWCTIIRDWTQCPQLYALDNPPLLLPNHIEALNGNSNPSLRQYSRYVVGLMPKVLKQELFPYSPDIWVEGEMSVEDFKTQYMLEFVDGAGQFLTTEQLNQLFSGEFRWQNHGELGEKYYAGIDFAGSDADGADFTHISVVRVAPNGERQKIYCEQMHGTRYPEQIRRIAYLFGGPRAKFRCEAIFADYTGCGRPPVQSLIDDWGLKNLTGIIFNAADTFTNSHMNMKNIMFAEFRAAVDNDLFKYPSKFSIEEEKDKDLKSFYLKMKGEWGDLEFEALKTVNKSISAPSGQHDDSCCADVLANFAILYGRRSRMPRPASGRMYTIR